MNFDSRNRMIKRLTVIGITAAVYAVATIMLPFLSYSGLQCRFSEILNLLAFINPVFAPGIILGCFIANLFSPFPLDWLIGTASSVFSMFFITRSKSLFIATLWPTVSCVLIGAEITFYLTVDIGETFLLSTFAMTTLTVMAGEFIVMTIIGFPLFKYLMKNKRFVEFLKSF